MFLRTLSLLILVGLIPATASAQMLPFPVAVEVRAGWAVPSGEFASSEDAFSAESGPAYAIGIAAYPTRSVGIFAGYQRTDFACERCGNVFLEETVSTEGLESGLQLSIPLGDLDIAPWVRAGLLYQTLAFSGFGERRTSDAALGFVGGLGMTIPVAESIEILPAIRYYALPTEFNFEVASSQSVDVTALSFDLGLGYRF